MDNLSYREFIDSIRESRENKWFENSECHHIIPRCLGGSNESENLIYLTYREHFIAHKLLSDENPGDKRLSYAYFMMCKSHPDSCTPEEYELGKTVRSNER